MVILPITLGTASVLALLFVLLSALTIAARVKTNTSIGTGESSTTLSMGREKEASPLLLAVRSHGNFAEYVPLSLILMGLLEAVDTHPKVLMVIALGLIVARLLHPIGLRRPAPNPFRAGGVLLQLAVLGAEALWGLKLAVVLLFLR